VASPSEKDCLKCGIEHSQGCALPYSLYIRHDTDLRLEAHESVGENGSAAQAGTHRFLFSLSKDSEYEVFGNAKFMVDEQVGSCSASKQCC